MNYRETKNYENLQRRIFNGVGAYGIPAIEPEHFSGDCNFISFNYAKSTKDGTGKGVHFFIDDYQFNRLWSNIDRYVPILSRFDWVMTPDFSTYTDFPKAIQIYNHYRKHWVGAYLQEAGVRVIPTISWSGYTEMVSRLHPGSIIFYGDVPEECMGNIVRIRPFTDKFKEAKCDGW